MVAVEVLNIQSWWGLRVSSYLSILLSCPEG